MRTEGEIVIAAVASHEALEFAVDDMRADCMIATVASSPALEDDQGEVAAEDLRADREFVLAANGFGCAAEFEDAAKDLQEDRAGHGFGHAAQEVQADRKVCRRKRRKQKKTRIKDETLQGGGFRVGGLVSGHFGRGRVSHVCGSLHTGYFEVDGDGRYNVFEEQELTLVSRCV